MLKLSYENLFKMLIDMTNTEIMEKSKISKSTLYKMKNSENITTNVLLRIYDVLKCDISDIVEYVKINEYKSKFK
nr:helix-turn-helix transcriptional regulator [Candidatus Arthromitus sp. SFB-mouse]